ncbi:MAG: hypothetical protein ACR2OR_14425 [Hyphomicrobiales bacterium]
MENQNLFIKSLKSFGGAGVWKNYKNTKRLEFAPKTLIYGFNGSGKTTLSRVFDAIERLEIRPPLPLDASFSVQFSDGETVSSKDISNPLGG